MKFRKLLTLASVTSILCADLLVAPLALAQDIQHPISILAKDNQAIKAQYQSRVENGELVLSFKPETDLTIASVSAKWNLQAEQDKYVFKKNADNLYELRLPIASISPQEKFEIQVETELKETYRFTELSLSESDKALISTLQTPSTSENLTTTTTQTTSTTTSTEISTSSETSRSETKVESKVESEPTTKVESKEPFVAINQVGNAGDFEIVVQNVPKTGIKNVKVPVWSEDKGQDDIKWYVAKKQADGTYKVTVQVDQHRNTAGKYQVHLYFEQSNGKMLGILATSTDVKIPGPTGKLTISQSESSKADFFDVLVSNVSSPSGVKEVKLPVWSEENGQDDIKWYSAKKQSDGSYQLRVYLKDHKSNYGNYHVHLYYNQAKGPTVGVSATTARIQFPQPTGKLSIQNQNAQKGTFDVVMTNVSAILPVKQVLFPI